jgi:hypothetical protein
MGGTCGMHWDKAKCVQDFGEEASWKDATCKTYAYIGG